jgi:hypothetical protein
MERTAFRFFPKEVKMGDVVFDPTVLIAFIHAVQHGLIPVFSDVARFARHSLHFCANAGIGTKTNLHFCVYGGVGLAWFMGAWHDWRHGARNAARDKGLSGLLHWITALFGG